MLACMTLGIGNVQAQSNLILSNDASYATDDREFGENDTIYMKVEASDVDFSSVQFSKFWLIPRTEDAEYSGEFINNFDGTYTAEIPVAELDLVDHLWNLDALIEDETGNSFETRVLLRIGDPALFSGFEVRAVVQSVDVDFFVLKGFNFFVDDLTEFYFPAYHHDPNQDPTNTFSPDDGPQPASYADVQAGSVVRVKVEPTETGQLNARRVEIHGPPFVPGEVSMSGRVESIDQNTRSFVVRGRQVFINDHTLVGNDQEPVGSQEIPEWLVGRQISIYGEFKEDESILAHFVHVAEGVREELEVRGIVGEVSETALVVQGYRFAIAPHTDIEFEGGGDRGDGTADGSAGKATVNQIDPGLIVRVFGVITPEGILVAERISIESGVDNGIRLSGSVAELTDIGFSIRGWAVNVTDYTHLFNENFEEIPFEKLFEGQLILVFGEILEDGSIQAHHIEFRRLERDEFTLFGPITEIGEGYVKIWDVQFSVTEGSVFEAGPGEFLTFQDLSVGQLVEVVGLPDGSGLLNIERVHIPQGAGDHVRVSGRIANMLETGFDVLGKSVVFTPETQFRDRNYQPLDPAAFIDNAAVQVFGSFNPDGTIMAYEVMLTGADREEIELWGVIEAVNGDIVTVGGVDFFVAEGSTVFVEDETGGTEVSPADLTAGDVVAIVGVLDDLGAPQIEWVYVPRQESDQVRISGQVAGATTNSMVLWGNEIFFSEFTQFYSADYQPVGPDAIVDGANVDVFGRYDEFGVIQADVVELRGGDLEELSISGPIESFDGTMVVIGGTPFLVTEGTQIFDNSGEPVSGGGEAPGKYSGRPSNGEAPSKFAGRKSGLEDLQQGVDVEVFGSLDPNGEYIANVIHIFDEGDRIRISGPLEAIDTTGSLFMQGRVVLVGPETFIQNENFETVALETLVDGQYIEVYGEVLADGSIQAHNVEVRPGEGEHVEIWGAVESIQGDLIVVLGTAFVVSEFTFFNNDKGEVLTLADLVPGVEVNIKGDRSSDGVISATDIFVPGVYFWAWMNGEVQGVGLEALEVQNRTIVVGPETGIFDAAYTAIALADIQAGQKVFVAGELAEDGSLMAFTVEVRGADLSELQVFGPLASVNGDMLEVNGRTYTLTENTFISGSDGQPVAPEELASGQFISIIAIPDGLGGVVVAKIYVDDHQDDNNLRMRGAIEQISADGFVLQGRTVQLTEESMIVGPGYEPVPLESLEIGQIVSLFGSFDASGNVIAYKVDTQQAQLEEIEFRGVIQEVAGELVIIRDTEFFADPESFISDDKGFPLDTATLVPGTIVNIVGAPLPTGGLRIVSMFVGAGDGDRHVNISGQIAGLDHGSGFFEIQGHIVRVEDFVEVVGANFEFIRLADLADGASVRVFGRYEEDGSVHAYRIEVRSGESEEIEFRGRIEMHGDSVAVVRGLSFRLSPNTWIDDGQGQPLSPAQLQSGQVVSIVGKPGDANEYFALRIHVANRE